MPSAADDIVAAIAAAGPLRFDRFLELALYGDHGFYASGGTAGRRGDFLTSPEVGPLFGAVLARFVMSEHRRLGEPDGFTIVEAGAGPGTLARAMRAAAPELRYVTVEVSAAQRASHPPEVQALATMPPRPITGVVIANELLDNLPFRLLVFDGGWREAHVDVDGDRLVEILEPLADAPAWLPRTAAHGARAPWQQAAQQWVIAARETLAAGTLVVFDYVSERTADLVTEPWRAWLRTYRGHQRGGHYLIGPGQQDITVQVALDQLPVPDRVVRQADFLRAWGIEEMVAEGRRHWQAGAGSPGLAALTMRSRVREAEALCDPGGLGGFSTMIWLA